MDLTGCYWIIGDMYTGRSLFSQLVV